MAQASLGKRADAIASLGRAMALDPRLDRPYLNLGRLHLEAGERAQALAVLARLFALYPEHPAGRELEARARNHPAR
jgi:tetratricopeptide (TPR) repeat protein